MQRVKVGNGKGEENSPRICYRTRLYANLQESRYEHGIVPEHIGSHNSTGVLHSIGFLRETVDGRKQGAQGINLGSESRKDSKSGKYEEPELETEQV